MDRTEQEIQRMVEMELSNLTAFSMCTNPRFEKHFCRDERIRSRYYFYYVTPSGQRENEKTIRSLFDKASIRKDVKSFVFGVAFPDDEQGLDDSILSLADENITVIDATNTRMEQEANERYARNMVCYNLAGGRHDPAAEPYIEQAYEELRGWTDRLLSSPVTVYDGKHPEGAACETLEGFYNRILRENCEKYPFSPETMDLDGFFFQSVGARYYVRDGFYGQSHAQWNVTDPERTPERLFAFAWGDDSAWYDPRYAGEKIVILKKAFDEAIENRLKKGGKVFFQDIFSFLREPPYGLLPNIIGAILTGMFFRTWRDRGLIWTNGIQQDVLDDAHLLAMIENGIHNQRTYYKNSLADSFMLPDQRLSALTDAACDIFRLDAGKKRYLPDLRSEVRFAMEELPYPVLSALYSDVAEADREIIDMLIRFVRLTSGNAEKADGDELVNNLCSAFSGDGGLKERIGACLHGEALRRGFIRMLEKNGLDPVRVTPETVEKMCSGRREWKWIWEEECIVRRIQHLLPDAAGEEK